MSTEDGAEVATEEVPKLTEEKPAKEKKAKVPKSPKDKKRTGSKPSAPSHPPYFQMIKEAIVALNDKTGSSPYAIAKFMEEKHKGVLPQNYKKVLAVQLRNFTAKGKLVKVKASFNLSEAGKNGETKKMEKKQQPEREARKPREATKRKAYAGTAKKAKKAAAPKPKQPKSIRSPAAKKARKAAA
ncbi:histone H1-like [Musa acuminata AAA Group]|uniref:histone H1-like n=1 Tax=Musa acuminata AAA Group TaxID=214697 RepID=UPI0031D1AB06